MNEETTTDQNANLCRVGDPDCERANEKCRHPIDQFGNMPDTMSSSAPPKLEMPAEFDFIQHYYEQPGQTRSWNEFRLKPQIAERMVKAHGSQP